MKTVWIVSEGSPGHVSQSGGLADALSAVVPLRTVTVKGRTTVRGWLRPVIRRIMGPQGRRALSEKLLRRVADVDIPADGSPPDLIISSGGKSVFTAKTLAGRYGVPYVFIGERKPFPAEWFHTVISPVPGESSANSIDVELIPTPVTPEMIAQKGTVQRGIWCMIIGGASRSHRFSEKDWIDLAEGMNALAKRENIRWLLTTSRRTGPQVETVIKKYLGADVIEDAIWWAEKPRRELYEFMARSEVLFVTQDSVTMISEAVSAGKPVVAIRPSGSDSASGSFVWSYFKRLESNGRIVRIRTGELAQLFLEWTRFCLLKDNILHAVVDELIKRLK
jgi:hypothetical protein